MLFSHISDTHGNFPSIYLKSEFIIHSGDILPDFGMNDIDMIKSNQYHWMLDNIERFKFMIQERPFYFVPGNHDYLPSETIEHVLQYAGINAIDLTNKVVNHNGMMFYGSPYINYIAGYWNYELEADAMKKNVNKIKDILKNNHINFLVSHAPMYKILDDSRRGNILYGNYGIESLTTMFNYLDDKHFPDFFCFGHIHRNEKSQATLDFTSYPKMVCSNAATIQTQLEFIP